LQDSASGTSVDVHTLLLEATVLAARLGNEDLDRWLANELEGYPDDASVPPYRQGFQKVLMGTFANSFWKIGPSQVPMTALPKNLRDLPMDFDVRWPITSVDEMANSPDETIKLVVPSGLANFVRYYENMTCVELYAIVPRHAFRGIIGAVRTKVLRYAIEIEKENPDAGEAEPGEQPVAQDRLERLQQTIILGGTNVVTNAGRDASVAVGRVGFGDVEALVKEVERQEVSRDDVRDLLEAIRAEPAAPDRKDIGPRVTSWLGRMTNKAATGAWQVSSATGAGVLATLIAKYYGLI